jgi:ATP-dependent helicase/nuclease subunit B
MATIVRLALENDIYARDRWAAIAGSAIAWADVQRIVLRDAIVLVPFAQLLVPARRAFASAGGWMPRIETTKTLATSLGPPAPAQLGQLSFDPTLDALSAAALLRSQAWGAAWARRDARGFEQAVGALVATAHALARAAAALPPGGGAAHWAAARELLVPASGPGAIERLIARVALEWACLAPPPPTDRLFAAPTPAAWIVVQAGGIDALTTRLIAERAAPALVLDTDPADDAPFAILGTNAAPTFAVCDGFEHEAQCAAAQILAHVQRGELPIALIAQDRVLVRRIRALLDRHELRLLDETGWTLSTTRAAALVMSLLQAARPDAGTDDLLDWLKAGCDDEAALGALEAACRSEQVARVAGLAQVALEPAAARLWSAASALLAGLNAVRRQPLSAWLAALSNALQTSGAMAALQADDAGRQVLAALRLGPLAANAGAWAAGAAQLVIGLGEFRNWVDGVLEQATFRPAAGFDATPDVIVTPLAGAMLRPFEAIVLPGADDRHLGAPGGTVSLLSDAQAAALGATSSADRRPAELLAFAHLLATPRLTLLRRRVDGSDPLADSPLVERLSIALAVRGAALAAWHDPRVEVEVAATPIRMSAPSAPDLLPARLSASACEALRACPYRFFALNMLRAREDDELEREVEKRDYGNWLHEVLYDFHRTREAPADHATELARLIALASASQAAHRIADADFLPFAASFESFAPRYVAWLHDRDADGGRWLSGEDEVVLQLEALGGTELRGIVDRIDARGTGTQATIDLIDYKTGSASALREKVRQPLEDTQLAFYAALMRSRTELPLTARYLALDGSQRLEEIEHEGVEASAAALVEGLADELRRLRAGAGMPALGVGATCEYCAARGVCRRDHWADTAA